MPQLGKRKPARGEKKPDQTASRQVTAHLRGEGIPGQMAQEILGKNETARSPRTASFREEHKLKKKNGQTT